MKEFHLEMRLRNNRLLQRRLAVGLTRKELAQQSGVHATTYGRLESLLMHPINQKGEWKIDAKRLAKFFGVSEAELFPDAIFEVVSPVVETEIDGEELASLSEIRRVLIDSANAPDELIASQEVSSTLSDVIRTLSPREQRVIKAKFGFDSREMTSSEIADELGGISNGRVWQIEQKALRKLRHRSRTRPILKALGEDDKKGEQK